MVFPILISPLIFTRFGPSFLPRIVTALEEREEALNIILMCDNNYDVQMRLFALLSPEAVHRCPLHVVGFTDEVWSAVLSVKMSN